MRSRAPRQGFRHDSFLALALVFGCAPPPSFPEATLDVEDAPEASPAPAPFAQLSGRELPLHSSGAAEGDAWVLHESGYSGVFLRLEKRGQVTIRVTAAGAGQLVLALGDQVQSFGVAAEPKPYEYALELPPGTHFLRIDTASPLPDKQTALSLSSVSVSGAQFVKDTTDRVALDTANTFIQNYRKGRVVLHVHGGEPGEAVQIKLVRHAFDFGLNLPDAQSRLLTTQPAPDSEAARFQELVFQHFNTLVFSNGGERVHHEPERDPLDLVTLDRFLVCARDNAVHARLQTLLSDTRLLGLAAAGNDAAKAELLGQLHERIEYLVRRRAAGYQALGVLDEGVQRAGYWQAYGVDGIAQIFKDVARAVQAAGAETKLYLNERDAPPSSTEPSDDAFANGYRWHAEELRRAGAPLGGLGVQDLTGGRAPAALGERAQSPTRSFGALQNLSGTGLELALTDFSVQAGGGVTPERAADRLEETLRLVFGTPASAAAVVGSAWAGAADEPPAASVLFEKHFAPTPVGVRFEALMKEWDTHLNAPLGADGSLEFAGFYGAYLVQSGGKSGCLSVRKGQTDYELELQPAPRGPSGALRRCRSL